MDTNPLTIGIVGAFGFLTGLVAGIATGTVGAFTVFYFLSKHKEYAGGQSSLTPKIVIMPVDENGNLADIFTRAPKFAIIVGDNTEIIDNPYKDVPFNASHMVVAYLLRFNPSEVIVRNIGRNAEYLFEINGVKVRRVIE